MPVFINFYLFVSARRRWSNLPTPTPSLTITIAYCVCPPCHSKRRISKSISAAATAETSCIHFTKMTWKLVGFWAAAEIWVCHTHTYSYIHIYQTAYSMPPTPTLLLLLLVCGLPLPPNWSDHRRVVEALLMTTIINEFPFNACCEQPTITTTSGTVTLSIARRRQLVVSWL